jgi:putative NADH-flavin reductase
MKILILGATGDVGTVVTNEAIQRGHHVTACARNVGRLQGIHNSLQVETLDVSEDQQKLERLVLEHDAIVSALRPIAGQERRLVDMTQTVLTAVGASEKAVYVTGGAGPLKIGDGTGHTVLTAPGFLPESVRPIAKASAAQDTLLNEFLEVNWICLRPAAMLTNEARSGRYALGRDTLVKQDDGQSKISYSDFAVAMLDLIELKPAPRQRFTVGW